MQCKLSHAHFQCRVKLPKAVWALCTTLDCGRGMMNFVLSMCINFAILAGIVSRIMFKIVHADNVVVNIV